MENISRTILSLGKQYQGILKMVGAVFAFLLTLGTLINLINIAGFIGISVYPVFSEIVYTFCQIMNIICAVAGFGLLGAMLLLKPKHVMVPISLAILACASFFAATEDLFYYIWQNSMAFSYYFNYPYLFMAFLSLLTAVAWLIPAAAGYMKNKVTFHDKALIMLIIPAALFLVYFFAGLFTGVLFFRSFLYNLLEYALIAVAALIVLAADGKPAMESIREMNNRNAEQRWQDAKSTQPGQTAHASYQKQQQTSSAQQKTSSAQQQQPQRPVAGAEPEGYIGIVKLIILSIVTFGIYVYIWIYKTSRFFDGYLNRQGSFSPGVEVVLCLFVPFYFIYWIYKQTKAAGEAHRTRGNYNDSELAIINLLLCIFGLSIVAYALLQDQINKLVTGYTAPPSYDRPQNAYQAPQQTNYNYNFDPMTGEPIRKAPAAAPAEEVPVEEMSSEIFTEVPVKESSEEKPAAAIHEEPAAPITEEMPAEEIPVEVPAEEIPAVVLTEEPSQEEPQEKETPTEDPRTVAEQLENVKMLKQLLDAGVLTQEEFELKKKNILGL